MPVTDAAGEAYPHGVIPRVDGKDSINSYNTALALASG